jgi:hypothetical protein
VVGTSRSLDIIFEFKVPSNNKILFYILIIICLLLQELSKVNSEKFVIAVFALNALSG